MTVGLLLCARLALAATPAQEPSTFGVFALSDEEFARQAEADLASLQRYANGLRAAQETLKKNKGLFNQKSTVPYTPEQKRLLLTTWASMFDYVLSSEVIRQRYWDFVKEPNTRSVKHVWGYLLTHGALTTELAHGLTFSDMTAGAKQLEVLLDEPSPEYGLPLHAYRDFKFKVIHVSTSTQLMTGDAWLATVKPGLKKLELTKRPLVVWVLSEMKENSKAARKKLLKRGVNMFVKNAVDIASDSATGAIFPVQKGVAEWMGDTRVHRVGQPLISREQRVELLKQLQPGDVIVARQNWFISNIGLPGFWPHAELYLGTQAEFSAYFDDDKDVQEWVATLPGKPSTFSAHLASAFPEKWKTFGGTVGKDGLHQEPGGDPVRIMEAISEGVAFTGIDHGMGVDYLGVLRPRLVKLDKAKAMVRAFELQGRPYDFNFDFLSDSSMVCSELVYKAYQPSPTLRGLTMPLVKIAGRLALPPNDMVRLFDEEHASPNRQFDFVAFLDGREQPRGAFFNTEDEFRKTYRRMKWDIAQK